MLNRTPRLFCTLFDTNYASRGLALFRSIQRHFRDDYILAVLCMDEAVRRSLAALQIPHLRLLTVEDLADRELLTLRAKRPPREYCWTCAPALMYALLQGVGEGETVTYLDADLMFFADPVPIFGEMDDRDILIHEHRFGSAKMHMAKSSGVFNVGLLSIRRSPQGLACARRWRAQCIDACELDPERGLCGDQKYLDEWPALYDRLIVLRHKGAALAPWNIENYEIVAGPNGSALVDGQPLIFYHFHALRVISYDWLGRCWILPSVGYDFSRTQQRLIYKPYAAALRDAARQLREVSSALKSEIERPSVVDLYRQHVSGRLAFG
jgi:hypothetical protein